jgi:hypothetical protein
MMVRTSFFLRLKQILKAALMGVVASIDFLVKHGQPSHNDQAEQKQQIPEPRVPVSPDIQLRPDTHQCTCTHLHAGALLSASTPMLLHRTPLHTRISFVQHFCSLPQFFIPVFLHRLRHCHSTLRLQIPPLPLCFRTFIVRDPTRASLHVLG